MFKYIDNKVFFNDEDITDAFNDFMGPSLMKLQKDYEELGEAYEVLNDKYLTLQETYNALQEIRSVKELRLVDQGKASLTLDTSDLI
jgi:hypothetical protein